MESTKFEELNGVDLARLEDTVKSVQMSPELAEFKFRCENEWVSGGHSRGSIQGFYGAGMEDTSRLETFVVDVDEPELLLGENRGANPAEHLLNALAGCLTASIAYHAAAKGIEITHISSSLEGDLDLQGFLGTKAGATVGYRHIKADFHIQGDFSQEQKEELLKIGCQHSPVYNSLKGCVPIETWVH